MSDSGYLEAVTAWALACLRGKEGTTRARADKKAGGRPIERVAERFALDGLERRAVELLYAAERSFEVARELRTRGGFTVEAVRDVLGDARVDALCAPGGKLRRHALVCSPDDDGWLGGARAQIALGPGLARRLHGGEPSAAHLGPGARRIAAGGDGFGERFPSTARIVELVKEHAAPGLLTVEGCGRREAWAIAVAAARWHSRAALVIDGEALAPLAGAWTLVAAARRDADLDGDLLVVVQSAALGDAWRAAAHEGEGALVVLADSAKPREVVPEEGLAHRAVVLPALSASTGTVVSAPAAKKEDDGFDHIRAQAIRDAEKALGIVRRDTPKAPIPPPIAVTAPIVKEPVKEPVKELVKEIVSAKVAAPSVAPPVEDAGAKPKKRSKKGMMHFGDSTAEPAPAPVVIAPVAPLADTASLPYVDVPADASPDMLARIAGSCPNPNQRIEVIYKLGGFRSSAVVAVLRANTRSEHAGVRAAAEAVMASLFGPDWNRSRPVPKPVQRPPSDDKDRGPPGGW